MSVEDSWFTIEKVTGKKVQTKRHGRGKRWRVRNRGARTVSFDKRSDADTHDIAVKADLMKGVRPFDHSAGRVRFAEYAEKWLREHHYDANSRRTVRSRLQIHVLPTFGEMRMCDIRPSTVIEWLAGMRTKTGVRTKRPLAPSTIASAYVLLTSIMQATVRDDVLATSPCEGLGFPTVPKRQLVDIWEQDVVDELLAGVADREHAIPLLAATCGHRQSEAFAVAVEDVKFLRREIVIRHQVQRVNGQPVLLPPKRNKVRTVPLPAVTAQALTAHLERYPTITVPCDCCRRDNRILFSHKGGMLSGNEWNPRAWHPAVRGAGLTPSPATGLHQLRHYFASLLIDGGASPKQVQDYMGHAAIKTTMDIYGHLFERSAEQARSIIDSAFTRQRSTSAIVD